MGGARRARRTGFALIVVPQSSNWIEVAGPGRWVTIMAAFMVVSLAAVVEVNRRVRAEGIHSGHELELD